ncbi:hypothetical protein KC19_6G142700 [Ceratodon purpureus]|nr:hypothetical protein KC19_6G142700 [Ceratodon purpureus]
MVDIALPPFGGMPDTKVSLYAVFDGHGGDEASHLASQTLHKRFIYHFYKRVQSSLSASLPSEVPEVPSAGARENPGIRTHGSNMFFNSSTSNASRTIAAGELFGHSALGVILKEALAEAISDVESSFSIEAKERGLQAGSTACIVLHVDDHLLVASLGDSKALLCPATACSSPADATTSELIDARRRAILERRLKRKSGKNAIVGACEGGSSTIELTRDHRPDREDEKLRVEAAGGFVVDYGGLPRVNGQLAVSRSIGDLELKKFGVSAEPEWTGWLKIGSNASHLVIASDGIFEKFTTHEVCSVVSAVMSGIDVSVALRLPQVSDPLIALPPRHPHLNEKQNSRAIVPVPEANSGSASSNLLDTAQFMNFVQEEDVKFEGILGPLERKIVGNQEPDVQDEEHGMGVRDVAVGSEVLPHTPETPARVLAKAIVDAAFRSGSRDNLATIVVPLRDGIRHGHDSLSHENYKEDHAARRVSEAGSESARTLIDISRDLHEGELANDELLIISGMLVKGIGDGDCYELVDTVVGSSILPWRPFIEYTFSEDSNEAVKPVVERLPPSFPHGGVAGGQLEIYREHLICTPKVTAEGDIKEVCLPPEGLARFLSLIGSIPLDKQRLMPRHWDSEGRPRGSKSVPPYSIYHHRYMLQKNFARGAFGEIWLAVKRPCLKEDIDKKEFFPVQDNAFLQNNSSERAGYIPNGKYSSKHRSTGGWAPGHFRHSDTFILKRIMIEKGGNVYLSGLREKHFGEVFLNETDVSMRIDQGYLNSDLGVNGKGFHWTGSWSVKKVLEFLNFANVSSQTEDPNSGLDHIARYVESFEWPGKELWLVFRYEGKSLSSLLYNAGVDAEDDRDLKGFKVVQPSPWWRWLKTTEDGRSEMRSIIHQLLLAVKACHDRNITHRDIKPENMVVNTDRGSDWPSNLTVRIIDFGSAIDRYSLKHLYNLSGPSQAEQTIEYAPPEATLSQHWLYFHPDQAHVYDMWSVGIVMLELVLGTPHVFQISSRTRVLLDQQLEGMDEAAKNTIYLLRAYLEMCILLPGIPPHHHHHHQAGSVEQFEEVRLAAWKCTEEAVMQQIKQRDPLGIGIPDVWALRLLRELLQWYPEDRISVDEALKHPYFHPSQQR